jgi:phospholipid/cholesterol/gamma-HCH transport system substrate-binding protein
MSNRLEGARLGLFLFLGTVLLVVMLFVLGGRKTLFSSSIHIKSYFADINGLLTGAPVFLSGYKIGDVSEIKLLPDSLGTVEVTMEISEDNIKFIHLDSKARIETKGFIGEKYVAISPGTENYPPVTDGGLIQSEELFSVNKVIRSAMQIIDYTKEMTKNLNEVLEKINRGEGTLGQLINDNELYASTVNIVHTADTSLATMTNDLDEISKLIASLGLNLASILANLDTATTNINELIVDIQEGKGALGMFVGDETVRDSLQLMINRLARTSAQVELGAERFAEDMEALKHNWLFKKYFEEKGYWDLSEQEKRIQIKLDSLRKERKALENLQKELNLK